MKSGDLGSEVLVSIPFFMREWGHFSGVTLMPKYAVLNRRDSDAGTSQERMTLHAVITTVGGYAREDAPVPSLVGVYRQEALAKQVATLSGHGSRVVAVQVDAVPAGLIQSAEAMGFTLSLPPLDEDQAS